jgi:hypothetical protein
MPAHESQDSDTSEEDDNEEEESIDFEAGDLRPSLSFSDNEAVGLLQSLAGQAAEIDANDCRRGMHEIGCLCIEDFGIRSEWVSEKIHKCQAQYAIWLATSVIDLTRHGEEQLPPPVHWSVLGMASQWDVLKEFAEIVFSLPISEAENERMFSIRKHVVGDRGGRSKNDLVTARVRLGIDSRQPKEAHKH